MPTRSKRELLAALQDGSCSLVCAEPDGQLRLDAPLPRLLLPGSFNPLHEGHIALAKTAAALTGLNAAFELTIVNADKPPLSVAELERRLEQFAGRAHLWLTRAPTFVAKAALFPGTVFVVGADTAERIIQHRFYDGNEDELDRAMDKLRCQGCRFLVASRLNAEGRLIGIENLPIASKHRDLFTTIPASRFRVDLSSTQLRSANGPQMNTDKHR